MTSVDRVGWIHIRNGRLLCVRSRGKDLFYIPGGKREGSETDLEALVREVREELAVGLERRTIRRFGSYVAEADGKDPGTAVSLRCYTAVCSGRPEASAEIEELAWLGFEDGGRCSMAAAMVLLDAREKGLL